MKNHKLSITIDIEDWYHIPSVSGSSFSEYKDVNEFFKKWQGRYDYLSEPTQRVLSLMDEYDIKATFFVVADVVEHYPGLVESIAERGHEIACHGLHHACKIDFRTKEPMISQEEFEERTLKAKSILEEASGKEVIGYRAPNALIGGWMLDSLEKIGFKYDSSVCVNSFYNKSDSPLNCVSTYPYHPEAHGLEPSSERREIVEHPWAYYDVGIKIPTSGGPMLRFLGGRVIQKGLKQSLNRGPTLFYFHPLDISNEKFPKVGQRRRFYWLVKGKIVEKRIRYLLNQLNGISFARLGDYYRMKM